MNKILLFSTGLFFLLQSCCKDEPANKISLEGTTTIHDEVLDKFAPARDGSYYIFKCKQTGEIDSLYVNAYFKSRDNNCNMDSIFPSHIIYLLGSTLYNDESYFHITISTDCEDTYNDVRVLKGSGGLTFYYNTVNDYYCKSSDCVRRFDSLSTDYYKFYDLLFVQDLFGAYFCRDVGLCGFIAGGNDWELIRYQIK